VPTFNVKTLNELTTATGPMLSMLCVAGTTTSAGTNVTVNTSNAVLYADKTFAKDGFSLLLSDQTFTAIAQDSYGWRDTNSVSVSLPLLVMFSYDLNGNLLSDGKRGFDYDDENQLVRVSELDKPTIAPVLPIGFEHWNSFSVTNASQDEAKAHLRQTQHPNPESFRGCPG
jgi:hypothetical protein